MPLRIKKVTWNRKALERIIQKFVKATSELIKSHKVDFSTMEGAD
tara:strand:- start:115 stop:249 length:135 start_codon:yes stop_codon:yes gene_type:complete